MTIERMKELYQTGDWICVFRYMSLWKISNTPSWNYEAEYQLIHKSHEHILDGYLEGCDVYDSHGDVYNLVTETDKVDFIKSYNKDCKYLAVPKSLDNCYCESSELHYNMFSKAGYPDINDIYESLTNYKYLLPFQGSTNLVSAEGLEQYDHYKKVEFDSSIQNWVYCQKENEMQDLIEGMPTSGEHIEQQYENGTLFEVKDGEDSLCPKPSFDEPEGIDFAKLLEDTAEPINNFEEYGFTADFEGEILKEDNGWFHGIRKPENVVTHMQPMIYDYCLWNPKGKIETGTLGYNLTPIKSEVVYPIFKKNLNGEVYRLCNSPHKDYQILSKQLGLSTLTYKVDNLGQPFELKRGEKYIEEEWTDVPYDAKRGLYHGQPCFFHDSCGRTSIVYFSNKTVVDVEPIPLETLKTLPFIWEQYQAFIGE